MSEILNAALEYARRGWAVLPLTEGRKEPLGLLVPNGHHDATTDRNTIKEWWRRYPNANIGARVDDNRIILDVESANKGGVDGVARFEEFKAVDKLGPLPPTFTVKTATNGYHYHFKQPEVLKEQTIKKWLVEDAIELKFNGYVVMPPSVTDKGGYEVAAEAGIAFGMAELPKLPTGWAEKCIKPAPKLIRPERSEGRSDDGSFCERNSISVSDVLTVPSNAQKSGDWLAFAHPIHGSISGTNLHVKTNGEAWSCKRCDTHGDALTWVAVREGFIDCSDAGPIDADTFKRCVDVLRQEGIVSDVLTTIHKKERYTIDTLARWLIEHPTHLMTYYRWVIDDFHQGEWNLKTTMWRQIHRVAYHSAMALLHSDMTAPSRAGKTALMLKFLTLLPPGRKEVLTTLTPKAIWYKTLRWTTKQVPQVDSKTGEDKTDDRGNTLKRKVRVKESDPAFYVGKVIAILELSEMKDFGVLKALADEYEVGEFVHSTIIDQQSVDLKIEGPHSVMTTSVTGIQNDVARQVLNRFVQTPLDEPNAKGTADKLEMIANHDLDECTIDKDPRLPVLRRALELLWADGHKVTVTPPSDAVRNLVKTIDRTLKQDGFNLTQIRDFHTFALNAAFEKRFARGDPKTMQIQEDDVLEAWYILTTFGNFARGNLTRAEFKLLRAIPEYAEAATDASDLRQDTGLGVATINDALRVKEDPLKGQGKFLQYGYVNYIQGSKSAMFYRMDDGNEAVKKITTSIEVDGYEKPIEPLNPCPYPYKDLLAEIPDSVDSELDLEDSVEFGSGSESQEGRRGSQI